MLRLTDDDVTAAEARVLAAHCVIAGAHWCPGDPRVRLGSKTYYSVLLHEPMVYACPGCGERVDVPTCG